MFGFGRKKSPAPYVETSHFGNANMYRFARYQSNELPKADVTGWSHLYYRDSYGSVGPRSALVATQGPTHTQQDPRGNAGNSPVFLPSQFGQLFNPNYGAIAANTSGNLGIG